MPVTINLLLPCLPLQWPQSNQMVMYNLQYDSGHLHGNDQRGLVSVRWLGLIFRETWYSMADGQLGSFQVINIAEGRC